MGATLSCTASSAWWQRCRADTPGCGRAVHFNNAGASLPPRVVLESVMDFVQEEALEGGYETANKRAAELALPYRALAQLLNCSPAEIAIVGSATSAWAQVFWGIPFKRGDVVVTSVAEYGSNMLAFLQAERRFGVAIQVVRETADGDIDIAHLTQLLAATPRPVLVAVSHVPTSSGRVYDAAAVGAAAAAAGVPFLLDACQSAGQLPLDVQALRCDFLTGTSRKYLRGPRGIGFLYARAAATGSASASSSADGTADSSEPVAAKDFAGWEPALLDIHGGSWLSGGAYALAPGAARYEQYELSCAAKAGFGVAVQYALEQGVDRCWQRTQALAAQLRTALAARVPGCTVHDVGRQLCGIVSFSLADEADTGAIKAWLAGWNPPIRVSISGIGSSRGDFEARGLTEVVRSSVHYYNSEAELEVLVGALTALVAQRRGDCVCAEGRQDADALS